MEQSPAGVETELVDLSALPISALREFEAAELEPSMRRVRAQIERPRANIGNTGPPGRVD